jgi:transposase-like protein
MVLIPARCLYCQSDYVTKRGKTTAGKQRYRCHNPDCTPQSFLLDPAYVHTITKQEQTIEDVDLVVLAYGGRRRVRAPRRCENVLGRYM